MNKDNIKMYFNKDIVKKFAKHEQNEKNFTVAKIIDQAIIEYSTITNSDFYAAELGWWAHPDRYHNFFEKLIKAQWKIDRVDISPYMLKEAKQYISSSEYKSRFNVINFIENDIISYLKSLKDNTLDLAIMKYTIDHIEDLNPLFELLNKKLKKNWVLISWIWILDPNLKSISTNARFLYNWKEFPKDETKILKDWDTFWVKFFVDSGNPKWWYIPWAETHKYYHSEEKMKKLSKQYWFLSQLWDHSTILKSPVSSMQQNILILEKSKKTWKKLLWQLLWFFS